MWSDYCYIQTCGRSQNRIVCLIVHDEAKTKVILNRYEMLSEKP
jgi:hypothetical protein